MERGDREERATAAEDLSRAAVRWMLEPPHVDWDDPTLYRGRAGTLVSLLEARALLPEQELDEALGRGLERLVGDVDRLQDCSLYFGLTGTAYALHALGRDDQARRALQAVRARSDGGRWSDMFELLAGNAGVGLGALHVGEVELAVEAVTPYLSTWTRTDGGVNWPVRPTPPRSHHLAHGTLGIAYALAAVGRAADRTDLVELAIAGAEDVVSRNVAGADGFLVPHSDPPHRPDLIERFSLGWCNGPAGDAQAFRLLGRVTAQERWRTLADRCWHTVTTSGLPRRTRPGFWDNNGRCCGTAGVLALACDRILEHGDGFDFADVLVDDLLARAARDEHGARWSNREHRREPADLDPRTGWAMGSAGIVRELVRYSRLCRGERAGYAVDWPDHPPVIPTGRRRSHASARRTARSD